MTLAKSVGVEGIRLDKIALYNSHGTKDSSNSFPFVQNDRMSGVYIELRPLGNILTTAMALCDRQRTGSPIMGQCATMLGRH